MLLVPVYACHGYSVADLHIFMSWAVFLPGLIFKDSFNQNAHLFYMALYQVRHVIVSVFKSVQTLISLCNPLLTRHVCASVVSAWSSCLTIHTLVPFVCFSTRVGWDGSHCARCVLHFPIRMVVQPRHDLWFHSLGYRSRGSGCTHGGIGCPSTPQGAYCKKRNDSLALLLCSVTL